MVYILQCHPETLAQGKSESPQGCRKSIYFRNSVMGAACNCTDSLWKRNTGTALGDRRFHDRIPDIRKRSDSVSLKRNLYQTA